MAAPRSSSTSRPVTANRLRQPGAKDPDELRRRGNAGPGRAFARWCFTVECDSPRRWAAAFSDPVASTGRDDRELAVGGGPARISPSSTPWAVPHASSPAAASHSSRPSIGIAEVVIPRPTPVGRAIERSVTARARSRRRGRGAHLHRLLPPCRDCKADRKVGMASSGSEQALGGRNHPGGSSSDRIWWACSFSCPPPWHDADR